MALHCSEGWFAVHQTDTMPNLQCSKGRFAAQQILFAL